MILFGNIKNFMIKIKTHKTSNFHNCFGESNNCLNGMCECSANIHLIKNKDVLDIIKNPTSSIINFKNGKFIHNVTDVYKIIGDL